MDADTNRYEFYANVTGEKQGVFPDDNDEAKGKGARCYTFEYGAEAASDPTRGAETAARFHEPLYLLKAWSASSPNFLSAFLSNELLTTIKLEFARKNRGGEPEVFETLTLTNATLVSFRRTVGIIPGLPFAELERIGLRFEAMEIKAAKKAVRFDFKNRK